MPITATYLPDNGRTNHPVVIGIPGLIHGSEPNRVGNILRDLATHGIAGLEIAYSDISRRGEKGHERISCHLDLETALEDIKQALRHVQDNARTDHFNRDRVGVLTSSVSSGIFAQLYEKYAIRHGEVKAHAGISPLLGWNQFRDQKTRDAILASGRELDLSLGRDRENGITRIMPYDAVKQMAKMDGLESLKRLNEKIRLMGKQNDIHLPKNMTVIGKYDKTSNPDGMREFHKLMGGRPERLIEVNSDHGVPEEDTNHLVVDFFIRKLKQN